MWKRDSTRVLGGVIFGRLIKNSKNACFYGGRCGECYFFHFVLLLFSLCTHHARRTPLHRTAVRANAPLRPRAVRRAAAPPEAEVRHAAQRHRRRHRRRHPRREGDADGYFELPVRGISYWPAPIFQLKHHYGDVIRYPTATGRFVVLGLGDRGVATGHRTLARGEKRAFYHSQYGLIPYPH